MFPVRSRDKGDSGHDEVRRGRGYGAYVDNAFSGHGGRLDAGAGHIVSGQPADFEWAARTQA